MRTSDSIKELAAAVAQARLEFPKIERGCTAKVRMKNGGEYSYDYADLSDVLAAVSKPLAKYGVSISHDCVTKYEPLRVETTVRLEHSSGEWKESSPLCLPCDGLMSETQQIGSACTYGRRYTTQAILGISTETDDDGNGAGGNDATTTPRAELPPCPKCKTNKAVIKSKFDDADYVCFKGKKGCGAKWFVEAPPAEETQKPPETTPPPAKPSMSKLDQVEIDNLKKCLKNEMFDACSLGTDQKTRKAHASAVTQFCIGKSWDEVEKTPGLAAQVKEAIFQKRDAGQDWIEIYNAAKAQAGLATELEQAAADAFG